MRVNAERAIQILSQQLGTVSAEKAMVEAYAEDLEKKIQELEGELRGVAKQREEDAPRASDTSADPV
jgi:prefoldin subunit 5